MIYVGIVDTSDFLTANVDFEEKLDKRIAERIEKHKNKKEKILRISAYILLDYMYKKLFCKDKMPEIFYTNEGKPYFKKPENENNSLQMAPKFNISHSENLSVVAINDSGDGVGVDVQTMPKNKLRIEKIAERFFAPFRKRDVLFAGGAAKNENVIKEETFDADIKYFVFSDGGIVENPAESPSFEELPMQTASGDFISKWTVLESVLKLSGGGFSDFESVDRHLCSAAVKTLKFKHRENEYSLSISIEKKEK